MADNAVAPSPALAAALAAYQSFLISDDQERVEAIEAADRETRVALARAVDPLYGEINALLDTLTAAPHPLPGDLEQLEDDLNSLAQAAMEAGA